jgi:hypothetical protein
LIFLRNKLSGKEFGGKKLGIIGKNIQKKAVKFGRAKLTLYEAMRIVEAGNPN